MTVPEKYHIKSLCRGKHLVSPYNPSREADRFIDQLFFENTIDRKSLVIILGAIGNFLRDSLCRKGLEAARIYTCHYENDHVSDMDTNTWIFGSLPFSKFLVSRIGLDDIRSTVFIEWKPTVEAYPDKTAELHEEVRIFRSRLTGNLHTFGILGKRWLRNCVRNLLETDKITQIRQITGNVFLAIPGETLDTLLPVISSLRDKLYVVSLSSSVLSLAAHGIHPDMIIQTDGGYYARRLMDYHANRDTVLCMTTGSAPFSRDEKMLLRNGNPLEQFFPERIRQISACIPDQGTVTATALSLLSAIIQGRLFVGGLDLDHAIDSMHTRFHLQQKLWSNSYTRTEPYFTRAVRFVLERSCRNDNGRYMDSSMTQYRDYLAGLNFNGIKIFRVNPSKVTLSLEGINTDRLYRMVSGSSPYSFDTVSCFVDRKDKESFVDNMKQFASQLGSSSCSSLTNELLLYLSTPDYLKNTGKVTDAFIESYKKLTGFADGLLQQ